MPGEAERNCNGSATLQVILQTLLPSSLTDCSATLIRRALSNRQIQPFNK
jgi:hypothetical protein